MRSLLENIPGRGTLQLLFEFAKRRVAQHPTEPASFGRRAHYQCDRRVLNQIADDVRDAEAAFGVAISPDSPTEIKSVATETPSRLERASIAPTNMRQPLSPVVTPDSSRDWSLLRRRTPVNYMLPTSIGWLKTLPWHVRPMALVTQYPRIANCIALEWNRPAACRACFIDLLVDRRGTRKGFPADVHGDLTALRDYYCRQDLQSAE